jgi:putative ABC transport system ATP-binding protein/lipoprotein-releasing system ATP-binding protein
MTNPLVRASSARRVFGQGDASVVALREASFEIMPGDRIALVGPSGSGKTTLLHLIAGLDEPTDGTVEWPALGPASDLRPGAVAIAFQGPSLLPPLTIQENVALPLLLAGVPAEDASGAARARLDELWLADVAGKLPEEVSGGQAQRAGLARALVGQPRLILADEPTGQLDRDTGRALMDVLLEHVAEIGAALVVATHDSTVAERLPIRWSITDRQLESGVVLRSL